MKFMAIFLSSQADQSEHWLSMLRSLGGVVMVKSLDEIVAQPQGRGATDEPLETDIVFIPQWLGKNYVHRVVQYIRRSPHNQAIGLVGLELSGSDQACAKALLSGCDLCLSLPLHTQVQETAAALSLESLARVVRLDQRTAQLNQLASMMQVGVKFGFGRDMSNDEATPDQTCLEFQPARSVQDDAQAATIAKASARETIAVQTATSTWVQSAQLRSQLARQTWRHACFESMRDTLNLALRDPLSQLFNRKHLETVLPSMMDQARQSGCHLGLAALDMNGFKAVNDTHGHPTGDALIAALGRNIATAVRENDFAARVGGDEFVVLMPQVDDEGLQKVVKRLRYAVDNTNILAPDGSRVSAGVSIGSRLFMATDWRSTPPLVLAQLDDALYRAKKEHYETKKER